VFIRQMKYVLDGFYWQKANRNQIGKRQLSYIKSMLDHCRKNVEHYKLNNSYKQDVNSFPDFSKLPILRKKDIREEGIEKFQDPFYTGNNRSIHCITSGSTGEPLRIIHDWNCYDYHTAVGVRRVLATGRYLPTYRLLHIRPVSLPKRKFEKIGLFRRDIIPSSTPLEAIKEKILKEKPQGLVGYPVYFRDLISVMSPNELDCVKKNLKLLFTESEMLTKSQRNYIEKSLGTEIFDEYSAYETLSITFECSCHRHHIVEDRLYLEIVDDDGYPADDGTEGNIVLTSFMEKAMPLVRYWIGDKGICRSEPCPCGRTFKTLELTQGRTEDYIVLDNGEKIYSATILHLAAQLEGVRECYIYQDRSGEATFYYVPLEADISDSYIVSAVNGYFSEHTHMPFKLKICRSDTIPRTAGEKARLIYSELNH
jgi:phenylacetate-CoA ligase